jgi:hypothetical protein
MDGTDSEEVVVEEVMDKGGGRNGAGVCVSLKLGPECEIICPLVDEGMALGWLADDTTGRLDVPYTLFNAFCAPTGGRGAGAVGIMDAV